jgi:uncharacterized protein
MEMARVIHFELTADDPERLVAFYTDVFGWKAHKFGGPVDYWLVSTGEGSPGIDGGVRRRQPEDPNTINTLGVEDLDAAVEKVTAAGGKVVMPRDTVHGVGYLAYCQDPQGTMFGMMQSDESAGS